MQRTLIVAARKSKNLSQSALARLINAKASQISRIELGYGDPSPEEAAALMRVLGLKQEDLNVGLQRVAPSSVSRPPMPVLSAPASASLPGKAAAAVATKPLSERVATPASVSAAPVKEAPSIPATAVKVEPQVVLAEAKVEAPRGLAASARQAAEHSAATSSSRAPFATATASGNIADFAKEPDLSAPASFMLVPDESVLQLSGIHPDQARRRISQAITYANRILHTSRIQAGIWLRWSQFVKSATARLRELPQV